MLHEAPFAVSGAPHVVVVGNEKGGSGKTTIAMHVAIGLLRDGPRVGTIDLDSNQKSLTRYLENRRIWAGYRRLDLPIPVHHYVARAEGGKLEQNEAEEFAAFEAALDALDQSVDFVVIDTPASDSYLMRLAHLLADTLITPLNDSFLDLGTLGITDAVTHEITATGHYAAMVCEARRHRRRFGRTYSDWIVIRNRFSLARVVNHCLDRLALRLGFRALDGCAERIVYRQLFATGLTAFDALDEKMLGERPGRLHLAAQAEVRDLYTLLKLPTNDRMRRRAAARAEWLASASAPFNLQELLVDDEPGVNACNKAAQT
jgi:chromosome partitioning protein